MNAADFLSLDRMIAPRLIRIVYWIGLAFFAILAAVSVFAVFGPGGFLNMVLGLLGAAAGALLWRVLCEVWIQMFEINDRLARLTDETKR